MSLPPYTAQPTRPTQYRLHLHTPTYSAGANRLSTATTDSGAPLSAIGGAMLFGNPGEYDTDTDGNSDSEYGDDEKLQTPQTPEGRRPKAGDRRSTMKQQAPERYRKSVIGEVEEVISFGSTGRGSEAKEEMSSVETGKTRPSVDDNRGGMATVEGTLGKLSVEGSRKQVENGDVGRKWEGKRVTIIEFPSPRLSPSLNRPITPERSGRSGSHAGQVDPSGRYQQPPYPTPSRHGLREKPNPYPTTPEHSPRSNNTGHLASPFRPHTPPRHASPQYHPLNDQTHQYHHHPPPQPYSNAQQGKLTHMRPQLHLETSLHHLPPPIHIALPPPSSPISPLLAAPPSGRSAPSSRPLSPGWPTMNRPGMRASIASTNESVRGFDRLREKKALFRGGEEELLAFSPRPRRTGGRSGLRNTVAGGGRMSTVDFWKRFSVMGHEGVLVGGKERSVHSFSHTGYPQQS